jgi:methionyl-tRNA formyltransferase
MEITKKMDEGGIVDVLEIPIDKYDTYDIITDKISKIS